MAEEINSVLYSESKTVDDQRRFSVDVAIVQASLRLTSKKGNTMELWGLVGAKHQIQILSPDHDLAKLREEYKAGTGKWKLSWDAGSEPDTDLMRKLGGLFEITCRHESTGTYRITLPTLAVDLKLVKTESPVIVFVSGPLFELWQPEAWAEKIVIPNVKEFNKQICPH